MNKKFNAKQLTLLGLMTALLLLMSFTPLGYLNIGPLAITFNVIPVAVSALALGPVGGLIAGSVFGLTSFLQAIGVGGVSMLGSTLFSINPFFSILLCFVPRMLDGFLLGYIFRSVSKLNRVAACFVTGFAAAFLNTLFFMSALILLFGQTEYMQGLINGQNILLFVCAFVGVNAVDSTGLLDGLTMGGHAAQAVHTDGHEQRSSFGRDIQNIADDGGLFDLCSHKNDLLCIFYSRIIPNCVTVCNRNYSDAASCAASCMARRRDASASKPATFMPSAAMQVYSPMPKNV